MVHIPVLFFGFMFSAPGGKKNQESRIIELHSSDEPDQQLKHLGKSAAMQNNRGQPNPLGAWQGGAWPGLLGAAQPAPQRPELNLQSFLQR